MDFDKHLRTHRTINRDPMEERARDLFSGAYRVTEVRLKRVIEQVFNEICGKFGRDEFFTKVYPAILLVYKNNYARAGTRMLQILNEGSLQKTKNIASFFKKAAQREISIYAKKEKFLESVIKKTEKMILKEGKALGVAAVILYGSTVKKTFHSESDVDIFCILQDCGQGIHEQYFIDRLATILKRDVEGFWSYMLNDENLAQKLSDSPRGLFRQSYILISPFPEVYEKVDRILRKK